MICIFGTYQSFTIKVYVINLYYIERGLSVGAVMSMASWKGSIDKSPKFDALISRFSCQHVHLIQAKVLYLQM